MNSTDTNSGGWGQCLLRTSTMPTLQSGMPGTLAQVRVPYVNKGQSTILYSDDYMFLPAEKEVWGISWFSPKAEGDALTQFAYYKNGGSVSKSRLSDGAVIRWWQRSVRDNGTLSFCTVTYSGTNGSEWASDNSGVAPCFCV